MNILKNPRWLQVRALEDESSQIYLESKSSLLRHRVAVLRESATAPPERIAEIEACLNDISNKSAARAKWNQYELAYRFYLGIAPADELIIDFAGLRSRTYRLDKPNKEIWSKEKLDQVEQEIQHEVSQTSRAQITSLAQAIWECGYRYSRDSELKSALLRSALCLEIFFYSIAIFLLIYFGIEQVAVDSPWQTFLIGVFGTCGGLLSATVRLRRREFYRHDLFTEQVGLFFRAAFGAIAAVIVSLFLELRVVDFPLFHVSSDSGVISPTALYIVGFAAGFTEKIFYSAMSKMSPKGGETGKDRK
jgi:hypothetical protein